MKHTVTRFALLLCAVPLNGGKTSIPVCMVASWRKDLFGQVEVEVARS